MSDENVTALRPAPDPHHEECAHGCSAPTALIFGACSRQCVKTPEWEEQTNRDAEARAVRFRAQIMGAKTLQPVAAGAKACPDKASGEAS